MKKTEKRVVFKKYEQHQMMLFPPSLEELIALDHPVRTVNQIVERINIDSLTREYEGGGTSSYHPKMLLKVLVYSYVNNVYSSRKIESNLKENIHYMWLSGMNTPDHNTINRFRSERLEKSLREIFTQVVLLLPETGLLSLRDIYVDGTKIEANANRYTFVWSKSVKYNKDQIRKQLEEIWKYCQALTKEESADTTETSFAEISPEKINETIAIINEKLKSQELPKKLKEKLKYAKKHWPENMERYESQEEKLQGRNSYSKTDEEATFMRMKEDHLMNGQLKAAYNLQLSTNNQFIIAYSLHQKSTDTQTLPVHLERYMGMYRITPQRVIADAGYGSEENYEYLRSKGITGYVKYNYYEQDKNPKKRKAFCADELYYNEAENCYYCPMGQKMRYTGEKEKRSSNGYLQKYSRYEAENCKGCPLRPGCHKAEGNRAIEVNFKLKGYKAETMALLNSEEGIYFRKKRGVDVEPVFANIKQNMGFRRFTLRGLKKAEIETGLIALAHNIKKAKIIC